MEKIVVLTILFAAIILYLKNTYSELALPATVVAGIIIISYSLNYFSKIFEIINNIIELSGINREIYSIIFKISTIGYLVEFGADTVTDFGLKSLADKLVFVGKIMIFSISLPIIYSIYNILSGLLT